MLRKTILRAAIFLSGIGFLGGCFYDKKDLVYPPFYGNCDSITTVRYSIEITDILDKHCKSCHYGDFSVSGRNLYDYNTISGLALDGKYGSGSLLSAVSHDGGNPNPMPQGAPKLSDCDINIIARWVDAGAPDN